MVNLKLETTTFTLCKIVGYNLNLLYMIKYVKIMTVIESEGKLMIVYVYIMNY